MMKKTITGKRPTPPANQAVVSYTTIKSIANVCTAKDPSRTPVKSYMKKY